MGGAGGVVEMIKSNKAAKELENLRLQFGTSSWGG
jgi:hypothetical protein